MWFWLSIAAMLCWSGSDLFSKMGSRPDDKLSHWKMVITVGFVFGLHAIWSVLFGGVEITMDIMIKYLPASLFYIFSMVLGYVGLRFIELSVSSPICNSSGALVFLLMCLIMPEEVDFSFPMILSVALICVGVVALGFVEMNEDEELKLKRRAASNVKYAKSFLALLFPLLYCLLDAAGTFADIYIMDSLIGGVEEIQDAVALSCNVAYELTFLLMGVIAFIYVVFIKKEKLTLRREGPKGVAAICETAGQLAYVLVMADVKHAAYGAPIIASYCAVSALWGRVVLKEKLSWKHYAAIFTAIAGIILMGILDP